MNKQDTPPLSSDQFREQVLPTLVERWDRSCFCGRAGFRKVVSFDFRDYGIAPTALVDAEILIGELVRARWEAVDSPEMGEGPLVQTWRCPQCGTRFLDEYEEFGVGLFRSFVRPVEPLPAAPVGVYLVGFRGGGPAGREKIRDFKPAGSVDEYLRHLTGVD